MEIHIRHFSSLLPELHLSGPGIEPDFHRRFFKGDAAGFAEGISGFSVFSLHGFIILHPGS